MHAFGRLWYQDCGRAATDQAEDVGELDEEMVFELQAGEVFRLGASMWRALEISKDQVLVEPAPGQQGSARCGYLRNVQ